VKRVPSFEEEEVRIRQDGSTLDLSGIPFRMNDWDSYALEEAVRLVERFGGSVTAVTIGTDEDDEVLRRSIACGAKDGFLIREGAFVEPIRRAGLAKALIEKEGLRFDLILTGVQAEDDQFASFGGILAGLLKIPYAGMVVGIEEALGDSLTVRREIEGGMQERIRISLPCVLSIQTGINQPRYVSIMGIRRASRVERKVIEGGKILSAERSRLRLERFFYPEKKERAKMLEGDLLGVCQGILGILREKGVL
jgi:electron transfer flavoprotein beta subunit